MAEVVEAAGASEEGEEAGEGVTEEASEEDAGEAVAEEGTEGDEEVAEGEEAEAEAAA